MTFIAGFVKIKIWISAVRRCVDCFVAALLAMTGCEGRSSRDVYCDCHCEAKPKQSTVMDCRVALRAPRNDVSRQDSRDDEIFRDLRAARNDGVRGGRFAGRRIILRVRIRGRRRQLKRSGCRFFRRWELRRLCRTVFRGAMQCRFLRFPL